MLHDHGFTLDLNFFFIDEEMHGNLQLNASNLEPNQDLYLGFIFRHAEALDQVSTDELDEANLVELTNETEPAEEDFTPDQESPVDTEEAAEGDKAKGFDGMRTRVHFTDADYSEA